MVSPACADNDLLLDYWSVYRPFNSACVGLSRLYVLKQQYLIALAYLDSAGGEYNPHRSCGNGFSGYRTFLSMEYADFYTQQGDTTQAIQRLLEYFLNADDPCLDVTKKLKALLLTQYSQEQITRETIRGINKLTVKSISYSGETERVAYISIFGCSPVRVYRSNKREAMAFLRVHRCIQILLQSDEQCDKPSVFVSRR